MNRFEQQQTEIKSCSSRTKGRMKEETEKYSDHHQYLNAVF